MQEHILIITDNKDHEVLLKKKLPNFSLIFVEHTHFNSEKLSGLLRFSFILIDESEGADNTFKMVSAVKDNRNTSKTPIIVITNQMKRPYLEKLIHSGVSNFIPMPLHEEDVIGILNETTKARSVKEIIASIKIPKISPTEKNIQDHEIIDNENINKVKQAFKENKLVTLALVQTQERPSFDVDLILQVNSTLFCLVSLKDDHKYLYEKVYDIKSKDRFAGIISSKEHNYKDIASMILDAKAALQRAKESPYGISFNHQV